MTVHEYLNLFKKNIFSLSPIEVIGLFIENKNIHPVKWMNAFNEVRILVNVVV